MNIFGRSRRLAGLLAIPGAVLVMLVSAGPAALATEVPPGGGGGPEVTQPQPVVQTIAGGMPGWQIALIAIGAALAAAVFAVLADRAWSGRRLVAMPK